MKPNEISSAIARAYFCEKVSKLWSQGREAQRETSGCSEFIDPERTDQGGNSSCGEQGRLLRSWDLSRERTLKICCGSFSNTSQRTVQCALWETARGHVESHPVYQKEEHFKVTRYRDSACCPPTGKANSSCRIGRYNKGPFVRGGEKWALD